MVSEDIQRRRDEYLELMRAHASKTPVEIIASLTETQSALFAILSAIPDERAMRKPAPDEWCLHQLANHAAFTERLVAKLVQHGARGELPAPADLEGAGIGMMPPDDDRTYRDVLAELERNNAALLAAVRDLPPDPNLEFEIPHPFFGPLNCLQWAGFQRVHDLDHIQHAEKILAVVR